MNRFAIGYVLVMMCCLPPMAWAYSGTTLYDQLCEVNAEWRRHYDIAKEYGLTTAAPIRQPQALLTFHLETVAAIFASRNPQQLSPAQSAARQKHLEVLRRYAALRDCPRNFYLPHRSPVFVDEQGRYCAVAYLMLQDGLREFCEGVQKSSNYIYIRQITAPKFHEWQRDSGLSLDELAWIQPGYDPWVLLSRWSPARADAQPVFLDSLTAARIYTPKLHRTMDSYGVPFSTIFMMSPYDTVGQFRKLGYKGKRLRWSALNERVTCAYVYGGEVYVGTDSTAYTYLADSTIYHYRSAIYKWTMQGKWEKVHDLQGKNTIYCFFQINGVLYAGGGSYDYTRKVEDRTRSYLMRLSPNKEWQTVEMPNYGGYIWGLIQQNNQLYLATVFNGLDRMVLEETPAE